MRSEYLHGLRQLRGILHTWCFFCTFAILGQACADESIDRARALMSQGKAGEAYTLLEPLEAARAGNTEFDYALGIAALDAGKPDRATIAFERVLAVNPEFAGARLDLARAYFAMGSDDLAKSEFDLVQKQDTPANVQAIIGQYLAAIEARQKRSRPALTGYAEAGGGSDSNITAVSGSFSSGVQQAYGIPNVQPTGNSVLRSADFTQYGVGVAYSHPVELQSVQGIGLYAGGDIKERLYQGGNGDFNSRQFDMRAGMSLTRDADALRLGVQHQDYAQRGATPLAPGANAVTNDRRTSGLTAEWRRALAPGRQISLFMQFNEHRFSTNPAQNINQQLFGGQFVNVWDASGKPLLMLSAFRSDDRALQPSNLAGTTNVSKELVGARIYTQYSLLENLDVFASVGQTERRDKAAFARSLTIDYVNDRTRDLSLGASWRVAPQWLLRAQVAAFENRSNAMLYDYRRNEASIFLRHDFK